ncbi:hypothetical protein [Neisseria montereyensis]|uniref:Uncharacterized protein n=1 Tax=Neisseria montereyensis TaxID=2973938 RepID=A0ABT2FB96_9NEIS|nr:hypothetical protein [Neisseria montereyensis]MCS4533240.1 hypothetical protein [Neisseria montereyensis]
MNTNTYHDNKVGRNLILRLPEDVMKPERLGAMHQTRLSFARTLLRKITDEKWTLKQDIWSLSPEGYGHAVYKLTTPSHVYHLVIFCDEIADEERNDRVIAQKWDVTFCLVSGEVDDTFIARLKSSVPLQEAGRQPNKVLVLARANKSVRVFEHIIERLAAGEQPDPQVLAQVGYILRTTAVYGNGKFGIQDFKSLENNPDFNQSFSAQMCAVYLLKQFSLDWVDYLARQRGGNRAVPLHPKLQRYLGVGNATGLGMAPYLINHPCIVDQWLSMREKALATVLRHPIHPEKLNIFKNLVARAILHLHEVVTIDELQQQLNTTASEELKTIVNMPIEHDTWRAFLQSCAHLSFEAQEIIISCLMELYPEETDQFAYSMNADTTMDLPQGKPLADLLSLLEKRYQWAIQTDFENPDNIYWFWYRSEDKEEPRLGIRNQDTGVEKELPLDIGRQVNRLYRAVKQNDPKQTIASFILNNPKFRSIARRVWTMGHKPMGDIQMNVLQKNVLPIHLLRCKLSMFGATKFDPRSDRWVRVTLFQGAPLFHHINADEWLFPLLPTTAELKQGASS